MTVVTSMSRGDYFRALGVVVIWGLNFVVMKFGLQGLSPMMLGAFRFAVASLPFMAFVRPPQLPWRFVVSYGLAQGLGQFGLLFLALQLGMTAGMASVVMQTQAFFTLILASQFLQERSSRYQWIGLFVAALGLVIVATAHGDGPGQMTLIGFILTLGAAFMWALSNLTIRFAGRVAPNYEPFPFIVWSSVIPVAPFVILAIASEGAVHVWESVTRIGVREGFSILYLALLATLLAYTMWTKLLKRHAAGRVAPFSLLVPVVGLWAAAAAFGEKMPVAQWVGTAAVLLGLLINQFGPRFAAKR
ncbi:MAG: EamA family transporter [Betaproteobacteria bacterium]